MTKLAKQERRRLLFDVLKGAFGSVGLSIYVLADTFFVAQKYGEVGLAVVNLSMPFFNIVEGLGIMLGMGAATSYTITKNATGKADDTIFPGILRLGVVVGLMFTLLGIFGCGLVTRWFGANSPQLYALTYPYLKIVLLASPLFVLSNLMIGFIRNDNDMLLATIALLASAAWNIFADWYFIWQLNWGMSGAALATASAPLVSILVQLCHFIPARQKNNLTWRGKFATVKQMLTTTRLGLPSFLMELANGVTIFIFNWVILLVCSEKVLIAYGIATNILLVALALFTGTAQGAQPFISSKFGRRQFSAAWSGLRVATATTLCLAAVIYLGVALNGTNVIAFFTTTATPAVIAATLGGMPVIMASLFCSAINSQICIFLASVNQAKLALLLVIIRGYLLVAPIVWVLARGLGALGVWLALPVIELLALLVGAFFVMQASHHMKKFAK